MSQPTVDFHHLQLRHARRTIQEFVWLKQINLSINAPEDLLEKYPNFKVGPDNDYDYVVKAQVTLEVDLSKEEPRVIVRSNTIDYGNHDIAQKLDKRSILNKIIDFFKNIFGANNVDHLSPSKKIDDDLDTVKSNLGELASDTPKL